MKNEGQNEATKLYRSLKWRIGYALQNGRPGFLLRWREAAGGNDEGKGFEDAKSLDKPLRQMKQGASRGVFFPKIGFQKGAAFWRYPMRHPQEITVF